MMMQCPKCLKVFAYEKSFCPFDGSALEETKERSDYIEYILDNKYQLDEKIGQGTTGTIYKATHLQLQAPVAVKLMRRDLINNSTAIERFRREAFAAMKIRHPNAIAVMDFGITAEDLVYVVMEFLVGAPLSERLAEKGKLNFLEANNIIQQVCAVLNVAHGRGIVHRDLKPENIFLHLEDGQEIVKVVDFGIAKLIQVMDGMSSNNLTGMGAVIGTPHYISPEQCTARPVDARSDIYSLGVILYRMLSGVLPFEGPNSMAVIYKQVTEMPAPLYDVVPDFPAVLNRVVMRAMEKEAEKRPSDVTTFARELAAAIKAITDLEFRKVFLDATDEDLDAAVLLTLDPTGSSIDYNSSRLQFERNTGKLRSTVTGEVERIERTTEIEKDLDSFVEVQEEEKQEEKKEEKKEEKVNKAKGGGHKTTKLPALKRDDLASFIASSIAPATPSVPPSPNSDTVPLPSINVNLNIKSPAAKEFSPIMAPSPLNGKFPECDLSSVIHTLLGLEVTGSLLVYTAKGTAIELAKNKTIELPPPFSSLYLERGNIERAKLGVRVGAEAFFQLLQMPVEGSYIFEPVLFLDELKNLEPIIASGEDLWQEALALKIELEEYKEIFPNILASIEICSPKLNWTDKVTQELAETIWYLLQQPEPSIASLLAKAPCCNAKTYRILTLLDSTQQIVVNEE